MLLIRATCCLLDILVVVLLYLGGFRLLIGYLENHIFQLDTPVSGILVVGDVYKC